MYWIFQECSSGDIEVLPWGNELLEGAIADIELGLSGKSWGVYDEYGTCHFAREL
jgi:hypothetical protein